MTNLSHDSESLLEAARGGDDPTALDRARVRAKLDARLAAGTTTAATVLKVLGALVVVAGVAVGAFVVSRGRASSPIHVVPPPAPSIAHLSLPPAPLPLPLPLPLPSPVPPPVHHTPPAPVDTLAAERAILSRATAALRDNDPTAALAAVAEHARRFPHGVLVEERAATKILALCAAGRADEGSRARDAFLTRYPHSVLAARVQAACAR